MPNHNHDGAASLDDLTALLLRILELRDPGAQSHGDGVAGLATELAARAGMGEAEIDILCHAATLHDVGKAAMPGAVLSKPSRLTRAEFLMVQQHTTLGHQLVAPLPIDPMIPDVVLYHHENFDGSGYPHGLKGEAIPLAARIIRVCDFYDALIDRRRYREEPAFTPARALDLLQQNGHCFDRALLAEFVSMMETRGI
jgi:putative two-component system response regulator